MNSINLLKTKGKRLTLARKEILSCLPEKPLTIKEILSLLKNKKIEVDMASVYRCLELFTDLELTREINFGDGKKRYEIIKHDHHHHHLICKKCKKIQDIELKEKNLFKIIKNKIDFKILDHNLEFFGLCKNCQKK